MSSVSSTSGTQYTSFNLEEAPEANAEAGEQGDVSAGVSGDTVTTVPPLSKDTGYAMKQMMGLFESSVDKVDTTSMSDQLKNLLKMFGEKTGIPVDGEAGINSEEELKVALRSMVTLVQSSAIANSSNETPIVDIDTDDFLERLFDIFKKKYEQAQQEAVLDGNPELVSIEDLRTLQA